MKLKPYQKIKTINLKNKIHEELKVIANRKGQSMMKLIDNIMAEYLKDQKSQAYIISNEIKIKALFLKHNYMNKPDMKTFHDLAKEFYLFNMIQLPDNHDSYDYINYLIDTYEDVPNHIDFYFSNLAESLSKSFLLYNPIED